MRCAFTSGKMADDLQTNLASYKSQLQQVDAALTSDPDNADLLKLRKDLQDVIDLTKELVKTQVSEEQPGEGTAAEDLEEVDGDTTAIPQLEWNVGSKCTAPWSKDGQYYDAVIEDILEDGSCTIVFDVWGDTEVSQVALLRPSDPSMKGTSDRDGGPDAKKSKSKKDLISDQREYKRKKSQKKQQRYKQLEEEREQEKNKWLDFNAKTFSKTTKGRVKKSIFATPDAGVGKVGVGTCGVGGRPMTGYQHQEKWKK